MHPLLSIFTIAALSTTCAISYAKKVNDSLNTFSPGIWDIADGWHNGYPFINDWRHDRITFSNQSMQIQLRQNADGSWSSGELRSKDYFGNGCFQVEIKPVRADGVVSAFFLFAGHFDQDRKSNGIHNEIDIEFLGMNTNLVQFNYWTNDDNYENAHEHLHYLSFDAADDFHHYAIEWSDRAIKWFVDGKLAYQVNDSANDPVPSSKETQFKVMTNVWAAHPDLSHWTGSFDNQTAQIYQAEYKNYQYNPGKCRF